jgi:methylmalonyl-CoA mutase cobalamin-binding domain/chain
MSEILQQIEASVYNGEDDQIEALVKQALDEGIQAEKIIQDGGVKALERLGNDFNDMIVFLPELMLAGDTMRILIKTCDPYISSGDAFSGKVIIGCAKGDMHDIGKSLVATQLAVNGFDVVDLGVDVATNTFIEQAETLGVDIIAVSSLLTTSQYYMEDLIKRLNSDGLRGKYRVIIGGGPIDGEYAEKIGADGYARTAPGSVKACRKLMAIKPTEELVIVDD